MKWLCILILGITMIEFTPKHIEHIRDNPHQLGWLVGKDKLTDMHSGWIKDVWVRKIPILAHRGSYKTTAIVEIGSLWWHLFHPYDRIGIFRKPYTQAANSVRVIKGFYARAEIAELFRYVHGIYPAFTQNKEGNVIFNFKRTSTPEGSLNAYSSNDPKTGTHLDEAVVDDFVTLKDRISKAEREKTMNGLMEIITNIMDPDHVPGFDGTPWHKDDGWKWVPGKIQKWDTKRTGLLSEAQIAKLKSTTTDSLYACNYDLKHIANKDAIFQEPVFGPWDRTLLEVYGHLDAKYSGDHTNGLTFMAQRPDGKIHAVGFTSPDHIDNWKETVAKKYGMYRAKKIYGETNADKGWMEKELKALKLNVDPYHEAMHKHTKIVTYLKTYWNDIIWAPETDPEYLVQITDYMEDQEPNDCPDSAASLIMHAFYPDEDMSVWGL